MRTHCVVKTNVDEDFRTDEAVSTGEVQRTPATPDMLPETSLTRTLAAASGERLAARDLDSCDAFRILRARLQPFGLILTRCVRGRRRFAKAFDVTTIVAIARRVRCTSTRTSPTIVCESAGAAAAGPWATLGDAVELAAWRRLAQAC